MKTLIIQYNAVNQKGQNQGFLKEVTEVQYNNYYSELAKNGLITNLEILTF